MTVPDGSRQSAPHACPIWREAAGKHRSIMGNGCFPARACLYPGPSTGRPRLANGDRRRQPPTRSSLASAANWSIHAGRRPAAPLPEDLTVRERPCFCQLHGAPYRRQAGHAKITPGGHGVAQLLHGGTRCGCHRMDRVGALLAADLRPWHCRHLLRMGLPVVQEDGFFAATWRLGGHLRRHRRHDHRGSGASPPGLDANVDIRHNRGLLLPLRRLRSLPTVLSAGAVEVDGIPARSRFG